MDIVKNIDKNLKNIRRNYKNCNGKLNKKGGCMMEGIVKILNENGLHARPAAVFVKAASQYKSEVNIEYKGSFINAKSIMNILSMGLKKDDEIKIIVNGDDEKEAMEGLVNLIQSKFDEV